MEKPKAGTIKMEKKKSSDLCRTTSPILVRKKGRRKSSVRAPPPMVEEVKESNEFGMNFVKRKESATSNPDDSIRKPGSRRISTSNEGGRRRNSTTEGGRRSSSRQSSKDSFEEVLEDEVVMNNDSLKSDIVTKELRKNSGASFEELLNTIDKEFGNKEFFSKTIGKNNKENNWRDSPTCLDNANENNEHSPEESMPAWMVNAVSSCNESTRKYSPPTKSVNLENDMNKNTRQEDTVNVENKNNKRVFGSNSGGRHRQIYTNEENQNSRKYSPTKPLLHGNQEALLATSTNEQNEVDGNHRQMSIPSEETASSANKVYGDRYSPVKTAVSDADKYNEIKVEDLPPERDHDESTREETLTEPMEKYADEENRNIREDPITPLNLMNISSELKIKRTLHRPQTTLSVKNEHSEKRLDDTALEAAKSSVNDGNQKLQEEFVAKMPIRKENMDIKPKKVFRSNFGGRNRQGTKLWQPPPKTSEPSIEFGINYKK